MRTDDEGVGLGLAIVESITHAHDGTLTPHAPGRRRALRHRAASGALDCRRRTGRLSTDEGPEHTWGPSCNPRSVAGS